MGSPAKPSKLLYVGWKAVEAGDGLLLGSAEGGFCGLEELSMEEAPTTAQGQQIDGTIEAHKKQGAFSSLRGLLQLAVLIVGLSIDLRGSLEGHTEPN